MAQHKQPSRVESKDVGRVHTQAAPVAPSTAVRPSTNGPFRSKMSRPAVQEKRTFTQSERDRAAEAGHAMRDGSYPVETVEDLRNAIRAVGRGSGDHGAIRRHIIRQARRLNATDLIPDNWASDGSLKD